MKLSSAIILLASVATAYAEAPIAAEPAVIAPAPVVNATTEPVAPIASEPVAPIATEPVATVHPNSPPPPPLPAVFTYPEIGYDFVGNDLSNKDGVSLGDCADQCKKLSGCGAVTFTAWGNGTCWFKTARNQVKVDAGANSTALWDTTPSVCGAQENVDYIGNDIGNATAEKPLDCCKICQDHPGCRAYSWNDYNNGTCWLKSKRGEVVVKANVTSAVAYPVPTGRAGLLTGTDVVANDIGNAPAAEAALCFDLCEKYVGCRAFSWANYTGIGGTCYFKSDFEKTEKNAAAISGFVSDDVSGFTWEAPNHDFDDDDLFSVSGVAKAQDCLPVCQAYKGGKCKAFAWNGWNEGTCWLKSAKGKVVAHDGVLAASLA